MKLNRVGERYMSNLSGLMTIVRYGGCMDVDVIFDSDGTIVRSVAYQRVKKGSLRNPNTPTVCGIGYLGEGKHRPGDGDTLHVAYDPWCSMIKRCYSKKYLNRSKTYLGCSVDPEWRNFQNFATWYMENLYDCEETLELDKDLLNPGNKVYSKENCLIVPASINSFITDRGNDRGEYLLGVSYETSKCFHNHKKRFKSSVSGCGYLGRFETELEAHNAWRAAKKSLCLDKINYWGDRVPKGVIKGLYSYYKTI